MKNIKWLAAASLTHNDMNIEVGTKIRLYGKETIVKGFYGCFNEGLGRWETIIRTTGRSDPFERSIDVIDIISPYEPSNK